MTDYAPPVAIENPTPFVPTDTQKVDARRHMGYAAYGNGAAAIQSFRYYKTYGVMEYRLGNLSTDEGVVLTAKLKTLNTLEANIYGVGLGGTNSDNLAQSQIAVIYNRPDEITQRIGLYNYARLNLCAFFELPPGPDFVSGGRPSNMVN